MRPKTSYIQFAAESFAVGNFESGIPSRKNRTTENFEDGYPATKCPDATRRGLASTCCLNCWTQPDILADEALRLLDSTERLSKAWATEMRSPQLCPQSSQKWKLYFESGCDSVLSNTSRRTRMRGIDCPNALVGFAALSGVTGSDVQGPARLGNPGLGLA